MFQSARISCWGNTLGGCLCPSYNHPQLKQIITTDVTPSDRLLRMISSYTKSAGKTTRVAESAGNRKPVKLKERPQLVLKLFANVTVTKDQSKPDLVGLLIGALRRDETSVQLQSSDYFTTAIFYGLLYFPNSNPVLCISTLRF